MADSVTAWLQAAGRHPLLTAAEEVHLGTLVRAWQDHPAGPDGAPPAIRRRGLRARERMVAANLRLVAHVAQRARRGVAVDLEDALQAGAIGLQRAAERFDPSRGYKFSTFAYWWIRQGIARESDQHGRTIRIPSSLAPAVARIERVAHELSQQLGRLPSTEELAQQLGIGAEELRTYWTRGQRIDSLDRNVEGADSTRSRLGDLLGSEAPPDDEQLEELRSRLLSLDATTYQLVAARWFATPRQPLKAAAAAAGLSPRAAQRRIDAAVNWLRLDRSPAAAPSVPPPSADGVAEQLRLLPPDTPAQ